MRVSHCGRRPSPPRGGVSRRRDSPRPQLRSNPIDAAKHSLSRRAHFFGPFKSKRGGKERKSTLESAAVVAPTS